MRIGIIGCGLIGQKRAKALSDGRLVACADASQERAQALARAFPGCKPFSDGRALLECKDIDLVIVATPHDSLEEMTRAAVSFGKHVLVEKPAARSAQELDSVMEEAKKCRSLVRVGFNHRYHRAFRKAKELVSHGELGELFFVRARYGHGGRVGYEREWRAKPEISGGGELIDQGVHLIDLARWFLGEFEKTQGFAHTYFWNMPVDDNAFLLLRTAKNQTAFLHASCTEWKNLFSFEIYGRYGKLHVEGLGGSYGVERLSFYKMDSQMGPPETTIWEYPMADDSWEIEMAEFFEDIKLGREPSAGLADARAALDIVKQLYIESGYAHHT